MNNDLIRRSALLEKSHAIYVCTIDTPYNVAGVVDVEDIVAAPAVDGVEVVRCGECEKRKTTECALSYFVFDDFDVEVRFLDVPDDFYCSYGERRTK